MSGKAKFWTTVVIILVVSAILIILGIVLGGCDKVEAWNLAPAAEESPAEKWEQDTVKLTDSTWYVDSLYDADGNLEVLSYLEICESIVTQDSLIFIYLAGETGETVWVNRTKRMTSAEMDSLALDQKRKANFIVTELIELEIVRELYVIALEGSLREASHDTTKED